MRRFLGGDSVTPTLVLPLKREDNAAMKNALQGTRRDVQKTLLRRGRKVVQRAKETIFQGSVFGVRLLVREWKFDSVRKEVVRRLIHCHQFTLT
jgi:hypothetical protein